VAGNGGFKDQVVFRIGCDGSPKKIQAMQAGLRADCIHHFVDVFRGKSELLAVAL
jgi:hypothetical protein